jgi:hypothetical protein
LLRAKSDAPLRIGIPPDGEVVLVASADAAASACLPHSYTTYVDVRRFLMTTMTRFPAVEGSNLLGERRVFPRDLAGKLNLIFIAYHEWQQAAVDTWVPRAQQLEASVPGFTFYELPVVGAMNLPQRLLLDYWMRTGIPDQRTRERTITLYIDRTAFRTALALPDEREIVLLLVERSGEVRWRGAGPYTARLDQELVVAVRQIASLHVQAP